MTGTPHDPKLGAVNQRPGIQPVYTQTSPHITAVVALHTEGFLIEPNLALRLKLGMYKTLQTPGIYL